MSEIVQGQPILFAPDGKPLRGLADISYINKQAVAAANSETNKQTLAASNDSKGIYLRHSCVTHQPTTAYCAIQVWADGARFYMCPLGIGGVLPIELWFVPEITVDVYFLCVNDSGAALDFYVGANAYEFLADERYGRGTKTANPAAGAVTW